MNTIRLFSRSTRLLFTRKHSIYTLLKSESRSKKKVDVKGWVNAVRTHKDVTFISINDGSCQHNLQLVIPSAELQTQVTVTYGACIQAHGEVKPSPGQKQQIDLVVDHIKVLGSCGPKEFPFKYKKHHPAEYTRQYVHLRPKTKSFSSLLRVRNSLTQAIHSSLQEDGYIQIHTPVLTSNDCEGAGEVFQVEPADSSPFKNNKEASKNNHFFDVPTYLTVSGQLHLESIAGAISHVYTLGPTFRAENSRSRHHLSEFYMLEAELAFITEVESLNKVVENLIKKSIQRLLDNSEEDVNLFWNYIAPPKHHETIDKILNKTFIRMSYSEAVDILEKSNQIFKSKTQWGEDLHKEHEHWLVQHCDNVPVFITDYPKSIKPFYMKENSDGKTVGAVDLLLSGVGEVCGGSLREHDYTTLHDKLSHHGLLQPLQWYLELRKFGTCPHGGFGLGFERLIQAVLGIDNIKDTIPFPRSTHNCKL